MNIFSMMKHARLMAPADADPAPGGAAVDRGDDFTPTEADLNKAEADGKLTVEELEAERAKLGLKSTTAATPAPAKADTPAAELTEEEKAAAAAAADDKKKDTRLPLARHESILAKERAAREVLEAELRTLKQGQAAVKTSEQLTAMEQTIVTLETRYTELMADGNTKEAQAVMSQIRQNERQVIEQRATFATQAATAQAIEQVRYDATVERLEAAYPQIVATSDEYDPELVGEVLELASAYEMKGFTPSNALQKAVGYILKPASVKQKEAVVVTPRVTEEAAAAALAERTAAARKTNVATANAQPPATAKVGAPSDSAGGVLDAKSVIKMSPEKFAALSEDDLARLRGDIA